jgi:hypothetical protein
MSMGLADEAKYKRRRLMVGDNISLTKINEIFIALARTNDYFLHIYGCKIVIYGCKFV